MKKHKKSNHISPMFYAWLIENFKIIIITRPDDPDYMELQFEPRNKRSGK